MDKIPVRHLKETFYNEKFNIRWIEPLTKSGDLVHNLHRHDFYFMLFVQDGKGMHRIDFIDFPVEENTLFFVKPGQVHELFLQQGTTGFMLQFTKDFYSPKEMQSQLVMRRISRKNYCALNALQQSRIESILTQIAEEYNSKNVRFAEVIKSYLEILFIQILRVSENPSSLQSNSQSYAQERLEDFQTLIERHAVQRKQVSDYALLLNLSTYQLNSITKTLLNKTASELISEYLVLEAKRLLISTTNQVNQIADQLGYDDPSYFIRFFKRQTGNSPEAFRLNFK